MTNKPKMQNHRYKKQAASIKDHIGDVTDMIEIGRKLAAQKRKELGE